MSINSHTEIVGKNVGQIVNKKLNPKQANIMQSCSILKSSIKVTENEIIP